MSRRRRCDWTLGALLGGALALSGCAATTVRSGKPPGAIAAGYDERWYPAFLFGALPLRDAENLEQICRGGWAEVRLRPDPFTALAGLLTLFVYSPSRLTIVCAAPEPNLPPALQSYPVPTLSRPSAVDARLPP